ncbi:MAG TPA: response regulator [Planctomycetota bacterium]|jgi:DNA-binding response OmpR family regulator
MSARILVVDDSVTVRMDLQEALERAGFAVTAAETLQQARAALDREPYHLVLLDVLLPDGDGVEFLREFKSTPHGKTPVVMLSSEAEVGARIRGLSTGADEYIGKPYDLGFLVARVGELLHDDSDQEPPAAKACVLLIDDSMTFRQSLGETLRTRGYSVILAESGEEGLQLASRRHPDAIIVNGVLPGIDGATVIRRLKTDAASRAIPCLMLTAEEGRDEEIRALEAGADAFLRKGEGVEVVLARLTSLLRSGEKTSLKNREFHLFGPKRLLAVDDSQTYLAELAGQLYGEGYDVVLARSGQEALDLLEMQHIDCILLDLVMPGMTGEEVCSRVKHSTASRSIPLIMVTARDDRESLFRGLNAGADDFIVKSQDFGVLKERVRAQIRRHHIEEQQRRLHEESLRLQLAVNEARASRELAETREKMVQELERKNAELRRANRVKDEFLAVLSHELRTPLTSMLGWVRILQTHVLDKDTARKGLQVIERNVNAQRHLIEDLLDVSRIIAGKMSITKAPLELLAVVRDTLESMRQLATSKGVELTLQSSEGSILANGDSARLQQMIWNLVSNAIKFTPASGQVRVLASAEDHWAVLTVTDTGKGISHEFLPRIFDRFTQEDSSTTRRYSGLGLGLAIVRHIVEEHDGSISVHSEGEDKGATFTVRLPLLTQPHLMPAAPTPTPHGSSEVLAGEKVLIAEDDDDVRELLTEILRLAGAVTRVAASTGEALAQIEDFQPTILVSDIGMPGEDGYVLITKVRALEKEKARAPIPAIALTGYAQPENATLAREAGYQCHVAKPIEPGALIDAIRSVLKPPAPKPKS